MDVLPLGLKGAGPFRLLLRPLGQALRPDLNDSNRVSWLATSVQCSALRSLMTALSLSVTEMIPRQARIIAHHRIGRSTATRVQHVKTIDQNRLWSSDRRS